MVVVLAALALFFFMQRRTSAALLALVFVAGAVVTIERLIHTVYVLDSDAGVLVVDSGRFSHPVRIPLTDIVSADYVPRRLLRPAHVLVRYGAGHECAVVPEDGPAFAAELMRRVKRCDRQQ